MDILCDVKKSHPKGTLFTIFRHFFYRALSFSIAILGASLGAHFHTFSDGYENFGRDIFEDRWVRANSLQSITIQTFGHLAFAWLWLSGAESGVKERSATLGERYQYQTYRKQAGTRTVLTVRWTICVLSGFQRTIVHLMLFSHCMNKK